MNDWERIFSALQETERNLQSARRNIWIATVLVSVSIGLTALTIVLRLLT